MLQFSMAQFYVSRRRAISNQQAPLSGTGVTSKVPHQQVPFFPNLDDSEGVLLGALRNMLLYVSPLNNHLHEEVDNVCMDENMDEDDCRATINGVFNQTQWRLDITTSALAYVRLRRATVFASSNQHPPSSYGA